MPTTIRLQLSVMMFFQFVIWGTWYVTMGTYLGTLGFSGTAIGDSYSTIYLGAIVAPILVGMLADRFFAAEKVLGVLHLAGGGVLYLVSTVTTPGPFFWLLLIYAMLYMPTLGLTNAIAFHQMADPGKQFPAIRVLGTIGWILIGQLVGQLKLEATATPFILGAAVSLAFGLYCFTLPATPPKLRGRPFALRDALGFDALALLRGRSFAVLVVASLLTCIPLSFYYAFTNNFLNKVGIENAAGKMGMFGQGSEILFMLAMPFVLAKLGIKRTMILGMVAWVVRYVLFAEGATGPSRPMLYTGLALHGICYDFFFVTGQIYVDRRAPKELQASAQGLITLATYGVGMLLGALLAGRVVDAFGGDFSRAWYVPAVLAAAVAIGFAATFKDDSAPARPAS